MIKDWKAHDLHMDFSNVCTPLGKPSDIDMFYIVPDYVDEVIAGFVIFGEIKNENGTFTDDQARLYISLIKELKHNGALLYITHDKTWQSGAESVDIANCKVEKYYYNNAWIIPKKYTTVNEAITKLLAFERESKYDIC